MYSQETLCYMGLDKDGQLIMMTDWHHLVLSPNESTLRQHQAKIFAKMNRWAQQYPEAAVRIDKVYLKNDGSAEAEISW